MADLLSSVVCIFLWLWLEFSRRRALAVWIKKLLAMGYGEQAGSERSDAHKHYSVSGNGVAYRKASDYLSDERVNSFLKRAEKVAVKQ